MKRLFTLLAATLSVMPISFAQKTGKLDLVVLSDTHVMAPELLQERGAAYDNYIANDRKLLSESPEILMSAVDRILSNPPDAVLVTGDMTKDGEVESHALVSQVLLKPLRDAGIRVFVTPGNHDIRNPHAVRFLGDSTVRTKTVSAEEFAEFYKDYGYGDAIARDPHSLSYVAQLDESTRLLSVDACMYEDNDFELDICVTDGRIKPETMDFIREQVGKAEKDGCRIVTMMHHGLIRHWKWQNIAMPEYLVRNWRKTPESSAGSAST